jgi:hypothetical protein
VRAIAQVDDTDRAFGVNAIWLAVAIGLSFVGYQEGLAVFAELNLVRESTYSQAQDGR